MKESMITPPDTVSEMPETSLEASPEMLAVEPAVEPADPPIPESPDSPDPDFPENTAALQALRDEMEGYLREKDEIIRTLQQREQQHLEAGHRQLFRTVLTELGAHPQAAELLSTLMDVTPFRGEKDAMETAARMLRDKYDALFLREELQGIPPVAPVHLADAPLTRSSIDALSEEEIIARWPQVRTALRQG